MPHLTAFLKAPSAELFRMAMKKLVVALDEEEKHAQAVPMWHKLANNRLTENCTRERVKSWADGKSFPDAPPETVRRIRDLFLRHGVENAELAKDKRATHQAQQALDPGEPEPFGNLVSSASHQSAKMMMVGSKWNTGDNRGTATLPSMPAVSAKPVVNPVGSVFGHLLELLFMWVPTQGTPVAWAGLLLEIGRALNNASQFETAESKDRALTKILAPLGVSVAQFVKWATAAYDKNFSQVEWPETDFQARLVKQFLGGGLWLEINKTLSDPGLEPTIELVSRWLKFERHLIMEPEIDVLVKRICARANPPNSWDGLTGAHMRAYMSCTLTLPNDGNILRAISEEYAKIVRPRVAKGEWP